jgi:ATP-binding cassette subfamily F protein 3
VLLQLDAVARSFGDRTLFAGVDLAVAAGERLALVGPNGAGKTSLLRIAAGLDEPDAGRRVAARGARVALLRQEVDPRSPRSVRQEVAAALGHLDALEAELRALEARIAAVPAGAAVPDGLAARWDALHARFEREGGFERAARIDRVLAGLGFREEDRDRPLRSLSGGWLMRVELARLLLVEPDVLLLDEPTNHLDLPSIQWFEERLAEFRGGVVAISHDRAFLRRFASRVAELEGGRVTVYPMGWDRYQEERVRRLEEREARERVVARKVAETERFIERFRAKASKARQVQSRVKALAKLERPAPAGPAARRMRLRIPAPARVGAVPIELRGVHKRYGDRTVYRGVDFQLRRGERVALAGPNGAGKSTLLRMVAGVLPFDAGERVLGHQVEVAFYAQHQLEALDAGRSVLDELASMARVEDVPRLRGHLGAFLFSGDDVDKKVAVLSGGEKARLALAKLLLRPANVLVLDEPTNHLDVAACEVLEAALSAYRGTFVFISHDRALVNALATRVVEVRDGALRDFPGNYDDYLRARGAAAGPGAGAAAGAEPRSEAGPRAAREQARADRRARERAARRLERIEAEILEKERALETLGWRLGDPEIWRDPERVRALEAEREALRAEIETRYRAWEECAGMLEAPAEETSPARSVDAPEPHP